MNLKSEIEDCCAQIVSNKLTDRRKYCERLSSLLENEEVLSLLNEGNSTVTWRQVISSLQECLRKDSEKVIDEIRKKGSFNDKKYPSIELFSLAIKSAARGAPNEINISKLIGYIIGCMKDSQMRECYNTMFLQVLKEYILLNASCRSKIISEDWAELFRFFKKLYEERAFEPLVLKCFVSLIKWGSSSGLPPCLLREQFDFFTKLCLGVSKFNKTNQQEDVLEIAFNFCRHTAKDNRVSCCKFGEEVISNFADFYELNGREAKIKTQLVKFFLLQVTIHQPDGVLEGHPCAYAYNWPIWRKCLKLIYSLLKKEINYYFKFHHNSFFITKGDTTTLLDDFSILFVEVSQQIFAIPDLDVSMALDTTLEESSQKRQRIEVNLQTYINNIQDTKSWLWIHVVKSLVKAYPNLLRPEDYLRLLQILSTLQIEASYDCLSVMLDIERKIDIGDCRDEVEKLWKTVGENALRAFGLNQHKDSTEKVLRQLIHKKMIDLEVVLQTYMSGVLNISMQSIKTLHVMLTYLHFNSSDNSEKKNLMNCVLNTRNLTNCDFMTDSLTASFLVNLTLRQWPSDENKEQESNENCDIYSDVKDIYFKSILERNIYVPSKSEGKQCVEKTYNLDVRSFEMFLTVLQNFVNDIDTQSVENLLNVVLLLINITDCLAGYKILDENKISSSTTMKLVEKILNYNSVKKLQFYENKDDRETRTLLKCVTILDKIFMFGGNGVLMAKVKDVIPFELLKTMVGVLNNLQEEVNSDSDLRFNLKKAITKALSSFTCMSNMDLNENQVNLLEVLAQPNYSCNLDGDYKLLLTFLESLKYAKPGIIQDGVLSNILKSVEEMCIARYHSSEHSAEILSVLCELFPHFAVGSDGTDQISIVELLKPFYDKREEYGPAVSLALLNCIRRLIEVDPESKFACWSGVSVVSFVPNFLCSDYQEVRFRAIETLVVFFRETSHSKQLTDFHRQEEIFFKMYEKSLEVFNVSGEITQERRTDEIIARTASVLHTFSSLIICNNGWIEECFYALVKLSHIKNLGSVKKILEIVNNHLYTQTEENCMGNYLNYILEKWLNEQQSIDEFPFKIFECETKLEFYNKYFETCISLLIINDRKDLVTVAKEKGFSEKQIVEKSCSKIFGQALCNDVDRINTIMSTNKILVYYTNVVGIEALKNCLVNNLDQILLCILSFLTDEKYILENLNETVIFSQSHLSVDQFKVCLNYIESFLCNGENIITFLIENDIGKFEKVLLALKIETYRAFTIDNKLKSLHRYTVWINMILNNLNVEDNCHYFFIRDTIYTLIHLIENHEESENFISAVCRFTESFLKMILPKFSQTFEQFLIFVVNSLKNFAVTVKALTDKCIEILEFLVVSNACHLMSAIEKLDKFPQDPKFDRIRNVHTKIKYGNKEASLKEEINFFLQHEYDCTRQDSLVHLRSVLAKEKGQLKIMYKKLEEMRGFSEDCQESALHKLIVMLAKMSCCPNEVMRFEAIKCLGELGPSNLTTLVLQPEKEVLDIECSPFELLTGHVLSLLTEYIVDSDINVVQTASETFYIVLDSREGKNITETQINFGFGAIDKKNCLPYFPRVKPPSASPALNKNLFITKMNDYDLWCTSDNVCHEKWIVTLVTSILETFTKSYLPKLIPLCKIMPKLCEHLLPLLINLLLYINDKNVNKILSQKINDFFSSHWNLTVTKNAVDNSVTANKKCVKCMLDVVSFVRLQKSYAAKSKTRQTGDLDLNYLQVAKAAEFCAAHFTALFYSELWCQAKIEDLDRSGNNDEYLVNKTMLDFVFENEEECIGVALRDILRNAYKAIGDLDALQGCGAQFLLKPEFRVEYYKELGNWDQVTQFYETQVAHRDESAKRELMQSLKKSGLYQLPLLCSKQTDECQFECLWRLGQWDVQERDTSFTDDSFTPDKFDKYRFYSLKALHENNEYTFDKAKKSQALCVIENLQHTSLESSQNIYPILTQLQALQELEQFAEAIKNNTLVSLLDKWKMQDEVIKSNDFNYIEPIIAQRKVILTDFLKVHHDETLKKYLVKMLLDFSDLARQEGQFHVASTNLSHLQFMTDLSDDVKTKIQLMDAQISWSLNNKLVGRHILNKLCKDKTINKTLQAVALKLSGQYMSETFSENRLTIISDYFLESLSIMCEVNTEEKDYDNILDTYDKLAQFADKGYQQVMTYMKSDLFQRKVANMEKGKQAATKMQKQARKTKEELVATSTYIKHTNIDAIEINNAKEEKNRFLKIALKYYFWNLKHCDKNDINIFRIMSLLLENKDANIYNLCKDLLPSYKYITMLPQLIPHISENSSDLYNKKVNEIVEKCAIDHPHHTLPLLMSLANANKDREFTGHKTKTSSNDARIMTAKNMIKKLEGRNDLREHIRQLHQLCQALIELAYYVGEPEDDKGEVFPIPKNQKITKIRNFDEVLLPTYKLPVSKTCKYSNIVGITSFDTIYHPVGGVNHPKRIACRGTDGKVRSQLLKGQDDLRQDAVMQQVFTIMNSLLLANKQTRHLLIRTYKIVPLSMRSGILEWVDNSIPIGDYLVGKDKKPGAHQIYRPSDKSPNSCRMMIKNAADKTPRERLDVFKSICRVLKPVFHKFLEVSFPHPTIWYERRRAYIHSVATTSMCGYILGIGDRHVSNILIDKTTAEVIHIDFGIAFEQGKVLPTPETVPFRLTRDMVDGMGVSGVEGIFRRSCEKTIEVLRQNSQIIVTILEVLLYDPLYAWTVTPTEANKRQTDEDIEMTRLSPESDEDNVNINTIAERALLRLREKLQGTELGQPTSIEHQVGTLIQQAMDPANLCKLFYGWQAYL